MRQEAFRAALPAVASLRLKPATSSAHHTYVQRFLTFNELIGRDWSDPVTTEVWCMWALFHCCSWSLTSLKNAYAPVEKFLRSHMIPFAPRDGNIELQDFRAGLNNIFGLIDTTTPSPAATMDQLRIIHKLLNHNTQQHRRLWVLLVLSFFGLLRPSELLHLRPKDVFISHTAIRITIVVSKTSLTPTHIILVARKDELCPVRAFSAFWSHLSIQQRSAQRIFFTTKLHCYSSLYREWCKDVKIVFTAVHPDGARFTPYSLKRGGVTAMLLAGLALPLLRAHGRWGVNSDVPLQYFDASDDRMHLPTAALLHM